MCKQARLLASFPSNAATKNKHSKNFVLCFRALSLLVAWLPFLRSHLYVKNSQAHIIDNEKMHILIQRHLGRCLCPFVWCVRLSEGQKAEAVGLGVAFGQADRRQTQSLTSRLMMKPFLSPKPSIVLACPLAALLPPAALLLPP